MTLPQDIRDLEKEKFTELNGEVAVRTTAVIESATFDIGNVKIEDGNSHRLADVEAVGTSNAIVVQDATSLQKAKINNFGSTIVAVGNTLTLATYTVPSGKTFVFVGGIVGGDEAGEFTFNFGLATIALVRNSGSNRTIVIHFPESPEASATTVVTIKAKNVGNKDKQFEALLSGYVI